MAYLTENLQKKWKPMLECADLPEIKDPYKRAVTAVLLENQEQACREQRHILNESMNAVGTYPVGLSQDNSSGLTGFDPILISLVRRAMPNLIAFDVCGVQPMSGPTGLIFAMKARYNSKTDGEAFYLEANTLGSAAPGLASSGDVAPVSALDPANLGGSAVTRAMTTAQGEVLGSANHVWQDMAFSIDRVTVTAGTRALKADYSVELAQDLKTIQGLDAETELTNILSTEILAEINREIIRTIYICSVAGATVNTTAAGTFDLDTDSNGRWSVEKFKGLMFQIEREANQIAKETRRGKGNIIITSSDVASALAMAGMLDYAPAISSDLKVDDTGNTFVGILNGRFKVYIDPYAPNAETNYFVVGYKGTSAYDAGLFYAPYQPLMLMKVTDPTTMQPRIGFKTRYGLVANPYSQGSAASTGALTANANVFYRKVKITHLM